MDTSLVVGIVGTGVTLVGVVVALLAWLRPRRHPDDRAPADVQGHADLELTVKLMGATDDNRTINATAAYLRWEIGLLNTGTVTATDVGLNFLLPTILQKPEWTSQDGLPLPDDKPTGGPLTTDELLPAPTGDLPSRFMTKVIDRLPPRRTHLVAYVTALFDLPDEVGVPVHLPVIARAWCAELPEDVDRVEERYDATVTKGDPHGPPG